MKILFLIAIAASLDTLPEASQLHASIEEFHTQKVAATLAEFDDASGGNWMNWTPSVGTGFNLQGQPRPTFSFSLSQVFANIERKKEKKAKRESIIEAGKLELAELHSQLSAMLDRHRLMKLELATIREIFEIDRQLHALETAAYEAAELSPMQYLPKRKAFIQSKLNLTKKEIELANLEGEILVFSHFR